MLIKSRKKSIEKDLKTKFKINEIFKIENLPELTITKSKKSNTIIQSSKELSINNSKSINIKYNNYKPGVFPDVINRNNENHNNNYQVGKYSPSVVIVKNDNQTNNKMSQFTKNTNHIVIDSNKNFDQKLQIFRLVMKGLKTNWTDGACTLELTRDNFFNQSIKQIKNIDLYKVG